MGYQDDNFSLYTKLNGIIIATNGGANYLCKNGIIPDVVIGDFDSILPEYLNLLKNKSIKKKFPINKDKSDTELAIEYCQQNGYNDITLINAIDGQLKHSLANLFIIEKFVVQGIKFHFYNQKNEIFVIDDKIRIKEDVGVNISLISLTDSTTIKKTEGLKFPLKNERLYRSSSRGISNITTKKIVIIEILSGILLLIKERS